MNKKNVGNADITSIAKLPFSQACENNKKLILEVLNQELLDYHHVFEVGSGTGQHSIYFAPRLPHLQWQTSDVINNHRVILGWYNKYPASNLHAPLAFDLTTDDIPKPLYYTDNQKGNLPYDSIFTANTLHIIAWPLVKKLFDLAGNALPLNGKLIIYGPFNENGQYSSNSNQQFDKQLRQRDSNSGIRNKEDVIALAQKHQLILKKQYKMPANNEILVFKKTKFEL
ncbi:DUF938 domain-containing protein [Psychrobacter sp.]|uniref:DUF938 domain-containing protein n=1 Tax=Psychrobacter sp. TaxID=56811 RepID=UPI0025FB9AD5|nr:DUF938 domain-containing protein [Psychrobacter sp.]